MKHLIIALFATAVCGGLAEARQGLPTQDALYEMGLSGMQIMSDREALEIRGFGYDPWHGHRKNAKKSVAIAYGHSYANVGYKRAHSGTEDGFFAKGRHKAKGEHGSRAGVVMKHKRGKGRRRGGFGGGDGGQPGGGGMATARRPSFSQVGFPELPPTRRHDQSTKLHRVL